MAADRQTRVVLVVNPAISRKAAMGLAKTQVSREGFYPVLMSAEPLSDLSGWRVLIAGDCDCGKGSACPGNGSQVVIQVSESELAAAWGDR